jgi:hypothetical protein
MDGYASGQSSVAVNHVPMGSQVQIRAPSTSLRGHSSMIERNLAKVDTGV